VGHEAPCRNIQAEVEGESGIYTITVPDAGSKKWAWRKSKASETCWLTLN
jgi:hypothetical protein